MGGVVIRDAAERARLVESYRASGLSVIAFAARERIAPSTLYQWLAGRPQRREPLRIARVIRRRTASSAGPPVAAPTAPVVLELGAVRVQVGAGFDAAALCAVLDFLETRARGASL